MNTTITRTPDTHSWELETTTTQPLAKRTGLLGGIGGLLFVATVIVQNGLRSGFPANDAGADEVMAFYADHRSATVALAALVVVGLLGITAFLGSLLVRVARGAGRVPAIIGAVGGAAIISIFVMVTAADVAIAGYIHRGSADVSVVEGLWVFHNAIFGFVLAAVGITLAALTKACAASGFLSKRWSTAGLVGAGLLLVGAATTPAIVDGGPTLFVGVLGFLVWVAFVIRASVALLRSGND